MAGSRPGHRPAPPPEFFEEENGPIHKNDMEIVANYLIGVEMAPMSPGMVHGADIIHLEADVHATANNVCGCPVGAWIAYLTDCLHT